MKKNEKKNHNTQAAARVFGRRIIALRSRFLRAFLTGYTLRQLCDTFVNEYLIETACYAFYNKCKLTYLWYRVSYM